MDRCGALALGPPSYLVCSHGATAVLTTLIALVTARQGLAESFAPRHLITVLSHGLLGVTGTGMQTSALTMAPAAYVNAIRRMSAMLAVLLGRALFGEPDWSRRLGAACPLLAKKRGQVLHSDISHPPVTASRRLARPRRSSNVGMQDLTPRGD